ncbi:TetR/AcrR family transcriptional regulator [Lujinxingia vulgaris]|uniref:TetR/AcrR family transcriptional regulator n=1 Tax=Lujinxingia vulgaris TaxID=2600176 RepID=A0A5C6X9Q2_9DELT|nr:TetR/AcrR family transcriptional regulator [Lujinxingia vulgaris]TXD37116.1 TetR/AcrR family transcriptional regulator [Lujinxingia vulgaris]
MKRLPTEQRRKQIADAALRIIAERGLRRFTVAAIAEEVGLADGTIFRHFDDKDDIVLEAVHQLEEALIAQETEYEGDPLERLGAFLHHRITLMRERPEFFKALFSDDLAQAGPPEAGERVRALKRRSMQFVRSHLQQAIDERLIEPGHSADALLYLVHGTALAIVFSGNDLKKVTGESLKSGAIWESLERLMRRS